MSANTPNNDDRVEFEVDGLPAVGKKGQMIIHVTDDMGVTVPRFCYHKKLPIAANCRMCLVEVEKAPKPMPACATPIAPGMKVFTRSPKALAAQKGVMEFLLINHPLDCPICDQGGECELQDVSLGYGRSASRFTERKRVVADKDIGPLIATEMTRCIHCTRCVRFLDVVAGQKELGACGRGENTEIGTYVAQAVENEMSGNVIDLCPVGALTAKPSRFTARAWELQSSPAIAAHDAVGSNIFVHSRRGRVMRVVPRENEAINEVWISDRDRYAYEGINSTDRALKPMVKQGGAWREVDWDTALTAAVEGLRNVIQSHGAQQLAGLASAQATTEELVLFGKWMRGLGSFNIDHRLRWADFSDDEDMPAYPGLGMGIADFEQADAFLVIGAELRKTAPIINHRVRKAALKGAKVVFSSLRATKYNYPVANQLVSDPRAWVRDLALLLGVLCADARETPPSGLDQLTGGAKPEQRHLDAASALRGAKNAVVVLGGMGFAHPHASIIRQLASVLAKRFGTRLSLLPNGPNSVGAWLAGALPHRGMGGKAVAARGMNARQMFENARKAYVLMGVEPESDCWDGARALESLKTAEFVVSLTSYVTDHVKSYANVILPLAAYAETSGSFANCENKLQSFTGVVRPQGEARPGWKILRVLGNLCELDGFDYQSSEEVRAEYQQATQTVKLESSLPWRKPVTTELPGSGQIMRFGSIAAYGGDAVCRRASSLQKTPDALRSGAHIGTELAKTLGISEGASVRLQQGGVVRTVTVSIDESIASNAVWLSVGSEAAQGLGALYGAIEIQRA